MHRLVLYGPTFKRIGASLASACMLHSAQGANPSVVTAIYVRNH